MPPNPFPVCYSTLAPDVLINEVLNHYPIGEVSECRFYSGGFNDTYRVRTRSGSTYYMRVYRQQWRNLEDVLVEIEALLHLEKKNYSAIRPVSTINGDYYQTVQAPEGERYILLTTEALGKLISYDENPAEKSYQYGRVVAAMHNAWDGFSSEHHRFQLDLTHFFDQPLHNMESFVKHRTEQWAYLQNIIHTTRQRISDLPAGDLSWGFCHGDLQGYHTNIDAQGTMTFFDFDCGGFGYRAYDLAVFRWCARLEKQEDIRWEPYLRGYKEVRPLNEIDEQAIPLFVTARYLWHIGVHTQNSFDWGISWMDDAYFDQKIGYLRQVEQDYWG